MDPCIKCTRSKLVTSEVAAASVDSKRLSVSLLNRVARSLFPSLVPSCPDISCLLFSCPLLFRHLLCFLVPSCSVTSCRLFSCPLLSCPFLCWLLWYSYSLLLASLVFVSSYRAPSWLVLSCVGFSGLRSILSCLLLFGFYSSSLVLSSPVLASLVLASLIFIFSCLVLSCLGWYSSSVVLASLAFVFA